MDINCYIKRLGRCDGGVAARVVICAVSLLILAGAIVMLLGTFETRKAGDYSRAERVSGHGLAEALKKLGEENFEWDAGFTNEPYSFEDEEGRGGAYSVAVSREARGDTLYVKIVSTGKVGSVTHTRSEEFPLPASLPGAPDNTESPEEPGGGVNGINEETE